MSRKKELFPFSFSQTFSEKFQDLMVTDSIVLKNTTTFAVYDSTSGNIDLTTDIFDATYLRDAIVYQRGVIIVDVIQLNNLTTFNVAFLINKTVVNPLLYDLNNTTDYNIIDTHSFISYDKSYVETLSANIVTLQHSITTNTNASINKLKLFASNIDNSIVTSSILTKVTNATYLNEGYLKNVTFENTISNKSDLFQKGVFQNLKWNYINNVSNIKFGTLSTNIFSYLANLNTLSFGTIKSSTLSNTINVLLQSGTFTNATLSNLINNGSLSKGFLSHITGINNVVQSLQHGTISSSFINEATLSSSTNSFLTNVGTISSGQFCNATISSGDFYEQTKNLGTITSGYIYSSTVTDAILQSSVNNTSTLTSGEFYNSTLTGSYLMEYPTNLGVLREGVMTNNVIFGSIFQGNINNIGNLQYGTLSDVYLDNGYIANNVTFEPNGSTSDTLTSNNLFSDLIIENSVLNTDNIGTIVNGNITSDLTLTTTVFDTITDGNLINNTITSTVLYDNADSKYIANGLLAVDTMVNTLFTNSNTITNNIVNGSISNASLSNTVLYNTFDNSSNQLTSGYIRDITATGTYYLDNDITHVGTFSGGYFVNNSITKEIYTDNLIGLGTVENGLLTDISFVDQTYFNNNALIGTISKGFIHASTISEGNCYNLSGQNNLISSGIICQSTLTSSVLDSAQLVNTLADNNLVSNIFINGYLQTATLTETMENGTIQYGQLLNNRISFINNQGILTNGLWLSNTFSTSSVVDTLYLAHLNKGTITSSTLQDFNFSGTSVLSGGTITNGTFNGFSFNKASLTGTINGGILTNSAFDGTINNLGKISGGQIQSAFVNKTHVLDKIKFPLFHDVVILSPEIKNNTFANGNYLSSSISDATLTSQHFLQGITLYGTWQKITMDQIYLTDKWASGWFNEFSMTNTQNCGQINNGFFQQQTLSGINFQGGTISNGTLQDIVISNDVVASNLTNGYLYSVSTYDNNVVSSQGGYLLDQSFLKTANMGTISSGNFNSSTLTATNFLASHLNSTGTISNVTLNNILNTCVIPLGTISDNVFLNSTVSDNIIQSSLTNGYYSSNTISNSYIMTGLGNEGSLQKGNLLTNTLTTNNVLSNSTYNVNSITGGIFYNVFMADLSANTLNPETVGNASMVGTMTNQGYITSGIITKVTLTNNTMSDNACNSSAILSGGYWQNNTLSSVSFVSNNMLNGTLSNGYLSTMVLQKGVLLDTINSFTLGKSLFIQSFVNNLSTTKNILTSTTLSDVYFTDTLTGTLTNSMFFNQNTMSGSVSTLKLLLNANYDGIVNKFTYGYYPNNIFVGDNYLLNTLQKGTLSNVTLLNNTSKSLFTGTLASLTLSNNTTLYGLLQQNIFESCIFSDHLASKSNTLYNGYYSVNTITGLVNQGNVYHHSITNGSLTNMNNFLGTLTSGYISVNSLTKNTLNTNLPLNSLTDTIFDNVNHIGTITSGNLKSGNFSSILLLDSITNGTLSATTLLNTNTFSTITNAYGITNTLTLNIIQHSLTNATLSNNFLIGETVVNNLNGMLSNGWVYGNLDLKNTLSYGTWTNSTISNSTFCDSLSGNLFENELEITSFVGTLSNGTLSTPTIISGNFESLLNANLNNICINNASIVNTLTGGSISCNTLSGIVISNTLTGSNVITTKLINLSFDTLNNGTYSQHTISNGYNAGLFSGGNFQNINVILNGNENYQFTNGYLHNYSLTNTNYTQNTLSGGNITNTQFLLISNLGNVCNGSLSGTYLSSLENVGTITNGHLRENTITNATMLGNITGKLSDMTVFVTKQNNSTLSGDVLSNAILYGQNQVSLNNGIFVNSTLTSQIQNVSSLSALRLLNGNIMTSTISQMVGGTISSSTLTGLNFINTFVQNGTFSNNTVLASNNNFNTGTFSNIYMLCNADTLTNVGTLSTSNIQNGMFNVLKNKSTLFNGTFSNNTISSIQNNTILTDGVMTNSYLSSLVLLGSVTNASVKNTSLFNETINKSNIASSAGYATTNNLCAINTLSGYLVNAGTVSNVTWLNPSGFANLTGGYESGMTLTGNNYVKNYGVVNNMNELLKGGTLSSISFINNNVNLNTLTIGSLSSLLMIGKNSLFGTLTSGTLLNNVIMGTITQMKNLNTLSDVKMITSGNVNYGKISYGTYTSNTFSKNIIFQTLSNGTISGSTLSLIASAGNATLSSGVLTKLSFAGSLANVGTISEGYLSNTTITNTLTNAQYLMGGNIVSTTVDGSSNINFMNKPVINAVKFAFANVNANTITNLSLSNNVTLLNTLTSGSLSNMYCLGIQTLTSNLTGGGSNGTLNTNTFSTNLIYNGTISNLGYLGNWNNLGTISGGSLSKVTLVGQHTNVGNITGGTMTNGYLINNVINLHTITNTLTDITIVSNNTLSNIINQGYYNGITVINPLNTGTIASNFININFGQNVNLGIFNNGTFTNSSLSGIIINCNTLSNGSLTNGYLLNTIVGSGVIIGGTYSGGTLTSNVLANTLTSGSLSNNYITSGAVSNVIYKNTLSSGYLGGGSFDKINGFGTNTLSNMVLQGNSSLTSVILNGTLSGSSLSGNVITINSLTSGYASNNVWNATNTITEMKMYNLVTSSNGSITTKNLLNSYLIGSLSNGSLSQSTLLGNVTNNTILSGGTLSGLLMSSVITSGNYINGGSLSLGNQVNGTGALFNVSSSTPTTAGWGSTVIDCANSGGAGGTMSLRNSANENITETDFFIGTLSSNTFALTSSAKTVSWTSVCSNNLSLNSNNAIYLASSGVYRMQIKLKINTALATLQIDVYGSTTLSGTYSVCFSQLCQPTYSTASSATFNTGTDLICDCLIDPSGLNKNYFMIKIKYTTSVTLSLYGSVSYWWIRKLTASENYGYLGLNDISISSYTSTSATLKYSSVSPSTNLTNNTDTFSVKNNGLYVIDVNLGCYYGTSGNYVQVKCIIGSTTLYQYYRTYQTASGAINFKFMYYLSTTDTVKIVIAYSFSSVGLQSLLSSGSSTYSNVNIYSVLSGCACLDDVTYSVGYSDVQLTTSTNNFTSDVTVSNNTMYFSTNGNYVIYVFMYATTAVSASFAPQIRLMYSADGTNWLTKETDTFSTISGTWQLNTGFTKTFLCSVTNTKKYFKLQLYNASSSRNITTMVNVYNVVQTANELFTTLLFDVISKSPASSSTSDLSNYSSYAGGVIYSLKESLIDSTKMGFIVGNTNGSTIVSPYKAMVINVDNGSSSAQVGIATQTPVVTLDVNGSLRANGGTLTNMYHLSTLSNTGYLLGGTATGIIQSGTSINNYLLGSLSIKTITSSSPVTVLSSGSTSRKSNGLFVEASGTYDACFTIKTVGTGTGGDPMVSFSIPSASYGWCAGIDNSDNAKFKIANSQNGLATNTVMTINSLSYGYNLGINNSSPSSAVDVISASATDYMTIRSTTETDYIFATISSFSNSSNTYTPTWSLVSNNNIVISTNQTYFTLPSGIYSVDVQLSTDLTTFPNIVASIQYSSDGNNFVEKHSSTNFPTNNGFGYVSNADNSYMIDATVYNMWRIIFTINNNFVAATGYGSSIYIKSHKMLTTTLERNLITFSSTSVSSNTALTFNTTALISDSYVSVNSNYLYVSNEGYYVIDFQITANFVGSSAQSVAVHVGTSSLFTTFTSYNTECVRPWVYDNYKSKILVYVGGGYNYIRIYFGNSFTFYNDSLYSFLSIYRVPIAGIFNNATSLCYAYSTDSTYQNVISFTTNKSTNEITNNGSSFYFPLEGFYLLQVRFNPDSPFLTNKIIYVLLQYSFDNSTWSTYLTVPSKYVWGGSTEFSARFIFTVTSVAKYWRISVKFTTTSTSESFGLNAGVWSQLYVYRLNSSYTTTGYSTTKLTSTTDGSTLHYETLNGSLNIGLLSSAPTVALAINSTGVGIKNTLPVVALDVNGSLRATGGTLSSLYFINNHTLTGSLSNGTISSFVTSDTLTQIGYYKLSNYLSNQKIKSWCFNQNATVDGIGYIRWNTTANSFDSSKLTSGTSYYSYSIANTSIVMARVVFPCSSANSTFCVKIDGPFSISRNNAYTDLICTLTSSLTNSVGSSSKYRSQKWYAAPFIMPPTPTYQMGKALFPCVFMFTNTDAVDNYQTITFSSKTNISEQVNFYYSDFSVFVKEIQT